MDKKEKNSLKRLSNVLKKNSLKIVLILFLFILCGYFYSYNMVVPKYKSVSTMLLTSDNVNKDNDSLTQNDINLNKNLIGTYGRILKSSSVLNKVIERLNLDMEEEELYKNIEIEEVKDTQIIEIGVIHENPAKAQRIAGTLNDVFIQEIREFYKIDNISIVDQASYETEPYNIHHMVDILMFLGAGIVACAVMISIIYVLDTTIKIEQDIEEYVGLNVVGVVPFHKSKTDEELIVHHHNKSVVSEAFKTIRTNIAFSKSKEQSRTILFTSCNASEGKSWITANMAVAYAWSNKNVIVVDADMRKGRQHNIFGVSNENGLSECLREIKDSEDYKTLKYYIKQTNVPKVHIMTIGAVPPNPSELLSSNKLSELVQMLKCVYDVVIIDGTPCNLVADSIPVSRIADSTVLVTECRRTKIEDLKNVMKLIQNVGGNIEGAILNKKEMKSKEYGKGYYYGKVDDENTTVELQTYSVKELIENRKQKVEEEIEVVEESTIKEEQITLLAEKIEGLEDKLLKIPDMNLAGYTKAVEDIRAIYENEIDKNKLAENIKENIIKNELVKKFDRIENAINQDITEEKIKSMIETMKSETTENTVKMLEENFKMMIANIIESQKENIQKSSLETKNLLAENKLETQNLLEEKMASLNSKQEINELMNKIESMENNMSSSETKENIEKLMNKITAVEQAVNSKDSEEKLSKVVEKIKLENEKKLEKLDSSDQIKEIMKELKKINTRYDKLALEVNKNLTAMKKASQATKATTKQTTKTKSSNKNNVIELETAKKKMKQEELIIEYGKEIEYEQLLDLAIGVYEFNTNQNQRRAE